MSKNIYELLNDANLNVNEYHCSELEKEEKNAIFLTVMKNENEMGKNNMVMKDKKGKNLRKRIVVFTSVFLAASIAVVGLTINQKSSSIKKNSKCAVLSQNFFTLTAGAYDNENDSDNLNSSNVDSLVLEECSGMQVNNFTGLYFKIDGENISSIEFNIDKGEICRIVKADSLKDEEVDFNHAVISSYGYDDTESSYEYTRLGNSVMEEFDTNNCYGFCLSEDDYKEVLEKFKNDAKDVCHGCYDKFNNAKLTIEVTYRDGSTEENTYTLASGKLKCDENNQAMAEFAGDGDPYIYGFVMTKE